MVPVQSELNLVPTSTEEVSPEAGTLGTELSFQTEHGQTPGLGSGCIVVNVQVNGAVIALPSVSLAKMLAV